jgi:hypothetical protein
MVAVVFALLVLAVSIVTIRATAPEIDASTMPGAATTKEGSTDHD